MNEDKKITDIVPNPAPDNKPDEIAPEANKEESTTPGAISKHGYTVSSPANSESEQTISTSPEVQGHSTTPVTVSKMGIDVKPPSAPSEQDQDAPVTNENPKELEPEDKTEEPKAAKQHGFEASDSLPDENDIKTTEATDDMQAPKIYDTKEYFVPIKNTTHSHGHIGTIIAGIISAIIVLGAIAFMAFIFY